ncbi:hypothetical protein ASPACDRAFT_121723 [Aspergillus aculeatus ATCC 16872]|uniref:Ig-like domain-containing protein n=1 Tax=Aspergillus aculeatus (strain ATCC 16872 / CBS 172.66 / WB 5094) TaxID=690307 RepID=A0A1L9WRV2_ASPA1|nr:uncharacterized protein ASPACDRAFT_121723 [Aspergillus aculeatus ATCC 16872]OJJ98943.1 hypothetical protein ASPACDRAFT_121723 [Aspergillus aculeatus ATCC 16872]
MPTLKSTAALFFFTLALGAAAQPTTQVTLRNNTNDETTCAVFNWDRQPVSGDEYPPKRISAAFSCPNTTTTSNNTTSCEITGTGGYGTYYAVTNLTGVAAGPLTALVQKAVDKKQLQTSNFSAQATVYEGVARKPLAPGQSAYAVEIGRSYCFTGTVSSCTGGDHQIADDTPVRVCSPLWQYVRTVGNVIVAYSGIVNVTREQAANLTDPFAGQNVTLPNGAARGLVVAGNGWLTGLVVAVVTALLV